MSNLLALTKVLLKTNFLSGFKNDKNSSGKKKSLGFVGILILLLVVFCSLGIPIIFAIDSVLEMLPIEKILIAFILPMAGITTIIFGVFSVVSVFYLSKDSDYLLPLPIKGRDIMLSKFIVSLITQYYILFMFILPCLIGVGIGIDAGVMYYIYTILTFLLLPVIPSVIVTFIILLITKFTRVMKNKDLFMYISMAFIVVFSFGYNYIIQNFIGVDVDNIGSTIGSLEESVLPYFEMIFPFYNSGVSALINYNNLNGLFSLVSFLAFNFVAVLIVYYLGDKLYLKTLISDRGKSKKKESVENVLANKKNNSNTFMWLVKKEWLIIKRTPIFMLNIVVVIFLVPVIFIVSFLLSFAQTGVSVNAASLANIDGYLKNPFIFLIVMVVMIFFTSSSFAAATSISREGRSAWFMKVIPVSYIKQINAKVFFAVILDMFGVFTIALIPIVLYRIPLYYVLCVFVPLLIIVIILNYLNIYLDLRKPKINWSEESVAVKQNMNGLVSMLITMVASAAFGIGAFIIYKYDIDINVILLSIIISAISGIMLVVVVYMFYKNKNKLLDNVD